MKRTLAIAFIAMLASASGLQRSRGDEILAKYDGYVGEPIRGFTALRTQSWHPVNRDSLILWTSINDAYLITGMGSCPDLLFANSVGVTSSASNISTSDHVRVGRDRCPIQQIRPIDVRRMKADRKMAEAKNHKKGPRLTARANREVYLRGRFEE